MYLYVYKWFSGGPDRQLKTDRLICAAADAYAEEKGIDLKGMSREICRTEKGKPYFAELPMVFSVSHTDDLWICLITSGKDSVGIDIQKIRDAKHERIAEKYFTDDEMIYLRENGETAFFEIWTRKEAYAKYTGEGITKILSSVSTISNDNVEFFDIDIREDVKCACCVREKGELCLRMI